MKLKIPVMATSSKIEVLLKRLTNDGTPFHYQGQQENDHLLEIQEPFNHDWLTGIEYQEEQAQSPQSLCEWRSIQSSRPRLQYVCPTILGEKAFDFMREVLGEIQKRSDGRWTWTRKAAKNCTPWKAEYQQGVTDTQEEAKAKVKQGWNKK